MRNLTKTLAVMSLLAPASVYSLGIGDIKLHSSLNQNLNAEISLVLSAGEKVSDIKVNLATPDKFDEVGVPWTSFLSKIKFATVVGAKGSVVIKLSSNEAVKEPFLDFLLEVSWPKGSLYREFTVLVDPPEAYQQEQYPVVTSSENFEPEPVIAPQNQTLQSQQIGAEKGISGESEYGPTRGNDTLWKIAERASRQEGVSVEQLMFAIYKENPRAFYQENMNVLLIGKTLKIPDREVVLKFSRKHALAELNRQTTVWKNRLTKPMVESASVNKDIVDNELTLIAPTETAISEKVKLAPGNEQTTTIKTATDRSAEIADKVDEVASLGEDALQVKVAELEKQLATMQQIIALKDQQLAAMQKQSQEKLGIQPPVIQAEPSQAEIASAMAQQNLTKVVVKPPVQSESEAEVFLDPYYLWVGGIGAGMLSLLGWVWWRKRKIVEEADIKIPFVYSNMSNMHESEGVSSPSLNKNGAIYDANAAGESSFLSEISFADFNSFDTDQSEIDPVSEADVYLAYGRYQQAEELMRETLKEQPDHDGCKLKLLEIIFSRKDKDAFEAYANELAETGKKDDVEFWAKVTEMGSQICQDSVLFSSGTAQFSDEVKTFVDKNHANVSELDKVKAGPVMDIKKTDFDLAAINASLHDEDVKEGSEVAEDGLLNFDLTSFGDDVVEDEWKNNESIDFDSGSLEDIAVLDKSHEDVFPKHQEPADKDDFESIDFDLSAKVNTEEEIGKIDLSDVNGLDEVNQSIDFSNDNPAALSGSISNDPLAGDFEFDFDMPVARQDSDMDELETKLDLAMAYIDMNDSDAAKDIAREVLEKGTPEQQLTAQTLLDRLK